MKKNKKNKAYPGERTETNEKVKIRTKTTQQYFENQLENIRKINKNAYRKKRNM